MTTTTLTRLVDQAWDSLVLVAGCPGKDWGPVIGDRPCVCAAKRKVLREELRAVAVECAKIADAEAFGHDACTAIRRAFGLKK